MTNFLNLRVFRVCHRAFTEKGVPATFTEGRAVDSRHRREAVMRHHMKKLTLLLALCTALVAAGPAWATGGDDAYRNGGENLAGALQGGGEGVEGAQTVSGGSGSGGSALPFTGLDVALILGGGG